MSVTNPTLKPPPLAVVLLDELALPDPLALELALLELLLLPHAASATTSAPAPSSPSRDLLS
jgi:hypothetical protein